MRVCSLVCACDPVRACVRVCVFVCVRVCVCAGVRACVCIQRQRRWFVVCRYPLGLGLGLGIGIGLGCLLEM